MALQLRMVGEGSRVEDSIETTGGNPAAGW